MVNNKKWVIPALAGVSLTAVIALVVLLIVYFSSGSENDEYKRQLELADKYYDAENYEKAEEAYNKAIEQDSSREEAYIGAANTYGRMGRYSDACVVIENGIEKTEGSRLKKMYINYTELAEETSLEVMPDTENKESEEIYSWDINNELFRRLLNYNFSDYKSEFGVAKVEDKNSKLSTLEFERFDGDIFYVNEGVSAFDPSTGVPYSDMKASKMSVADLSTLIINFQDSMEFSVVKSLFGNSAKIKEDDGKYYIYVEYNKCGVKIECDSEGTIKGRDAWNEISTLENMNNNNGITGTIMGFVINAKNGTAVKNAELFFRKGRNVKSGAAAASTKTDSYGRYEQELEAGTYTIEAKADGFIQEYYELDIREGETCVDENIILVPTLAEGSIQIVLEWGASPEDLDSHLDGITSDGHTLSVNFREPRFIRGNLEYANLDLDDTTSYGPETITLNDINGSYVYSVVDFTNLSEPSSTALASSQATVKLYIAGQPVKVYEVPQGTGTVWEVFRIEKGNVSVVNRIIE